MMMAEQLHVQSTIPDTHHAAFCFERHRFEPIDPLAVTEPALPWQGPSVARRRARSVAAWLSVPRALRAPHDDPSYVVDDIPMFVESEGTVELEVVERSSRDDRPLAQVQPCTVVQLRPPARARRSARSAWALAVGAR